MKCSAYFLTPFLHKFTSFGNKTMCTKHVSQGSFCNHTAVDCCFVHINNKGQIGVDDMKSIKDWEKSTPNIHLATSGLSCGTGLF